jgi:NitT/TauT family transport system substrate-binding protein
MRNVGTDDMKMQAVIIKKTVIYALIFTFILTLPSATFAEQKTKLKIGFLPITDHLTLGVAEKLYAKEFKHTELETLKFTDWATIVEALRAGSLDGAFLLAPLTFQARITGIPIKTVLLGHRDGSALIVKTRIGIDSPSDLKSKTVAIPSRYSLHNMLLSKFVVNAGLSFGDEVKTIEMSPVEMPVALFNGDIDAYIVAEPIGSKAEKLGVGKVLVLSNEIWKNHPDCLLVMHESVISNNEIAVQELVSALVKSAEHIEDDRKEAANIGGSFLGHSVEIIHHALTVPNTQRVTFRNLIPDATELDMMQDYMSDTMKVFTKKTDIPASIDSRFAEKAYLEVEIQK